MSCNRNKCSSYFTNLVSATRQNHNNKYTVVQGDYLKVNVMCIPMCGDIGVEVHENEDQLITVVCGTATVKLGNTRCEADCVRRLNAGDSVLIPAGTWHNVCNTGNGPLRLISVYGYGNTDDGCGCDANSGRGRNATNDCGCNQTTAMAGAQSENCGCSRTTTVNADRSNVFHAGNRDWDDMQTQDNGCSCAIDSGC